MKCYYEPNKIIKEPNSNDLTFNVTNESLVERYEWCEISKKLDIVRNSNYLDTKDEKKFITGYENLEDEANTGWVKLSDNKYQKQTPGKSTISFNIKKTDNDKFIKVKMADEVYMNSVGQLYIIDENGLEVFQNEIGISYERRENDDNLREYSAIDISMLENKEYTVIITSNIVGIQSDNKYLTINLGNMTPYIPTIKKLDGETSKILKNPKEGKEYFAVAIYKSGEKLQSSNLEYKKVTVPQKLENKVEEKINDIVENPLTVDNIMIYLIISIINISIITYLAYKIRHAEN